MRDKIKLDYRNRTVVDPCVFKGDPTEKLHFEEVFCQYAAFENEVRFENCVFEKEVIFGDEFYDEAFCIIKSDLIFDNCKFLKQVKLDGLQCAGHVIFKNGCKFEYGDEDEHFDYALSLSNATIGLGVCLQDVSLKAGINLSATTIAQVGCQFVNVKLNNENSTINFTSSFLGKELSIRTSNIICDTIKFEAVSVDNNQGTIQFGGNGFLGIKDNTQVVQELLTSLLNLDICNCNKITSVYKINKSEKSPLLLVNEAGKEFGKDNMVFLFNSITKIPSDVKIHYVGDNSAINTSEFVPVGEIIQAHENQNERPFFYVVFFLDTIYLQHEKTRIIDYNDYSWFVFHDAIDSEYTPENEKITDKYKDLVYEHGSHNGYPMIYAKTDNSDTYIAIYDLNHCYKIYKWNSIQCNSMLDLSDCHIGRGLYIRQSELAAEIIDMHSLTASHLIEFTDVDLHVFNVKASNIKVPDIQFNNIKVSKKNLNNLWWIDDNYLFFGINLDSAILDNLSISLDMWNFGYDELERFIIYAPNMNVKNLLKIEDNRAYYHCMFHIDLKHSILHRCHINIGNEEAEGIVFETEAVCVNDFKVNNKIPKFKPTIKEIVRMRLIGDCKLTSVKDAIKSGIIIGNINPEGERDPFHFVKQLDNLYEQFDRYRDQKGVWKFRNRMRIRRDHKCSAWFRIPANELLLNYGWSPWRIIFWLIIFIFLFDFVTCRYFGMDVPTSIVNGFVEFVPVSFNEPIVEQLHGINPQDPKYGPPILSFGYSALVTGYRLVSYTLLSVLIAAFAGYFRKKNQ